MSNREYPSSPMVAVAAVIVKDHHILLVKRLSEPGRGTWSIPGGLIKIGELVAEAVRREVEEETGLEVEVGPLVKVVDRIVLDDEGRIKYHYVILDHLAKVIGGEVHPSSDVSEARWVSFKDLRRYKLSRALEELFERVAMLLGEEVEG